MRWIWTLEGGTFVLRPEPRPPGLAEVGFLGRGLHRSAADPLATRDRVRLEQVHGIQVREAQTPTVLAACDAVHTRVPGLVLTVRTADCLPLVLADPAGRVAVIHAGWRGLAEGVIEATLAVFENPHRLHALLGPAIGPCCFEVGEEVAARFPRVLQRPFRAVRPHVDLFAEAGRRLRGAGVSASNISPPGPCTRCHQHVLHSHRGSGGGPGRIIAYAAASGVHPQEA